MYEDKDQKKKVSKEPESNAPVEYSQGSPPQAEKETIFLELNLERILSPLVGLLDLDACEVFLRNKRGGELCCLFHSGRLSHIWNRNPKSADHELFTRQMMKGEARVINLPNRRIQDLNPELKERAYGQVICYPILVDGGQVGFYCVAHSRRNLLTDNEMNFLRSLGQWMGDTIAADQKNRQIRTQIIGEERERIGMDLHDGIIQSLYGIGLSIENARLSLDEDANGTRSLIESSLKALQSAIADIRAYILNLRPRQLRHSHLTEGMQSLIREFRANTMIEVEMEGKPEVSSGLAREQTDALYHIFQEALSNIAKHAKATKVSVRLWRREDRLLLRINDNGTGFDLAKPGRRSGQGLKNMRARAEGAGGGMEVVSIRKQGSTLMAWVPWVEKKRE